MYWSLLVVAVPLVLYLAFKPSANLPDGPRGLPLIGVLPEKGLHLHQQLAKWIQQYGDFFSFNLGRSNVIVLSSVEAIQDTVVKKSNIYSSRPTSSSQADIITSKARIVNLPYGEQFRKRRRIVHGLLGIQNAKIFMPYQEYESRQMLKSLLDTPELFYMEVQRYSASVTFSLLVGARFASPDAFLPMMLGQRMIKFFTSIRPGAWLVDWLPFLNYLPDALAPWRRQARKMAVEMVEFWSVFLNDIKAMTAQGTAPDCFLSRLLESPEAKTLSSVEMAHITAELLTAGSETTGTSLQWFFKAMVTHPDSVREAQEELDRVVGLDRLPDWTDRPKLPYIGAMVTELHRWASSTPLAFFHATSDADIYRGKTINKATTVILNTYAIHNSDAYFPDHARYLPGRWLPADDKRHVRDGTRTASHMAFGTGRRECPGQHVADASLFIGISRILWAFNVSQGEYPPPPNATRGALPVLGPAEFQCSITPRSAAHAQKIRDFAAVIDPDMSVRDGSVYDDKIKEVIAKYA